MILSNACLFISKILFYLLYLKRYKRKIKYLLSKLPFINPSVYSVTFINNLHLSYVLIKLEPVAERATLLSPQYEDSA